jgi:hypothetical protein
MEERSGEETEWTLIHASNSKLKTFLHGSLSTRNMFMPFETNKNG